jgi:hypothetical protein
MAENDVLPGTGRQVSGTLSMRSPDDVRRPALCDLIAAAIHTVS